MIQLHTTRLTLRELSINDIQNIHELHSLPETDEFNTLGIPDSIEDTKKIVLEWLRKQEAPRVAYVFCIELKESDKFIGLIALNLGKPNYKSGEVWFKTHINYWRKGYTTEALKKLLSFCFNDLKLHRVEAGCAVDNLASIKVLEKAGMIREGRKRKILPIRGQWTDNYFYSILEEEFVS